MCSAFHIPQLIDNKLQAQSQTRAHSLKRQHRKQTSVRLPFEVRHSYVLVDRSRYVSRAEWRQQRSVSQQYTCFPFLSINQAAANGGHQLASQVLPLCILNIFANKIESRRRQVIRDGSIFKDTQEPTIFVLLCISTDQPVCVSSAVVKLENISRGKVYVRGNIISDQEVSIKS